MSPRIRKATAVVAAAVLMGSGGIGIAQAASGTTASGDRPAQRAGMATELAAALGADVAKIQTILDANRPAKPTGARPPGPPPAGARPSNAKVVAALASGLGIDEATVKAAFTKLGAAHKAQHTARQTAMYAALAKELGLSTDAVQAAFEANRPAKPAKRAA